MKLKIQYISLSILFCMPFFVYADETQGLLQAVKNNNTALVQELLSQNVDVTEKDQYGYTALVYALTLHNFEIAQHLIEKGFSVHQQYTNNTTLLHWAAYENDYSMVDFLLKNGADIHSKDMFGKTPLHYAVQYTFPETNRTRNNVLYVATCILQNNGSNACPIVHQHVETEHSRQTEHDPEGLTSLHMAVLRNNIALVSLLLSHGADINAEDSAHHTPLYWAKFYNYDAIATLLNKVKEGAKEEDTVPQKIEGDKSDVDFKDTLKSTELLLRKGAAIDEQDVTGKTPLHYAVKKRNYYMVRLLLEYNAKSDIKDSITQQTALHIAVESNSNAIVELLLQYNVDVNARELPHRISIAPVLNNPQVVYKKPDVYNVKLIIKDINIKNPEQDQRSFYKVFLDKIEVGRTAIGLETQQKEYKIKTSINKHLLRVVKYVLDEKKKRYVKLNNIKQPKPDYYYFTVPKDKIVVIVLTNDITTNEASFKEQFEKE